MSWKSQGYGTLCYTYVYTFLKRFDRWLWNVILYEYSNLTSHVYYKILYNASTPRRPTPNSHYIKPYDSIKLFNILKLHYFNCTVTLHIFINLSFIFYKLLLNYSWQQLTYNTNNTFVSISFENKPSKRVQFQCIFIFST